MCPSGSCPPLCFRGGTQAADLNGILCQRLGTGSGHLCPKFSLLAAGVGGLGGAESPSERHRSAGRALAPKGPPLQSPHTARGQLHLPGTAGFAVRVATPVGVVCFRSRPPWENSQMCPGMDCILATSAANSAACVGGGSVHHQRRALMPARRPPSVPARPPCLPALHALMMACCPPSVPACPPCLPAARPPCRASPVGLCIFSFLHFFVTLSCPARFLRRCDYLGCLSRRRTTTRSVSKAHGPPARPSRLHSPACVRARVLGGIRRWGPGVRRTEEKEVISPPAGAKRKAGSVKVNVETKENNPVPTARGWSGDPPGASSGSETAPSLKCSLLSDTSP